MPDYTKLLLHMNGVDGSTTFTDSSINSHTISPQGTAQIDTAQSKFGGAAGLFDGDSDYLTIPDSDDWYFDGDFTVDCWVRLPTILGNQVIFSHQTDDNNFMVLYHNEDNGWRFYVRTAALYNIIVTETLNPSLINTWYHIALVRNGNNWTIYKDGISIASTTDSDALQNYEGNFFIGYISNTDYSTLYYNGWIDEFRITKGVALWTTNFDPPVEEYNYSSIIFDSSAYAASGSRTWSHTIGNEDNRLLIVGAGTYNTDDVDGITYGGVSLTKYGEIVSSTYYKRVQLWYLINPAIGTDDIVVDYTQISYPIVHGSASFFNVNQDNPFGGNNGKGWKWSPINITLYTMSRKDLCIGMVCSIAHNGVFTSNSEQTELWNYRDSSAVNGAMAIKYIDSSSENLEWTYSGADMNMAIYGAVLRSYDDSGPYGTVYNDSSSHDESGTYTWSHTIGDHDNRLLLVAVSIQNISVVENITYGGIPLNIVINSQGEFRGVSVWYMINPPVGTDNIIVTCAWDCVCGASSFYNVIQEYPFRSLNETGGTGGTYTQDIITENGDMVFSAGCGWSYPTAFWMINDETQTVSWNYVKSPVQGLGTTKQATTSLTTISGTVVASSEWRLTSISIQGISTVEEISATVEFNVPFPQFSIIANARTSREYVLVLNFQGNEGATTWIEEAQNLVPETNDSCVIDTSLAHFGTACLKINPDGYFDYIVPGIQSTFTQTIWFRFDDLPINSEHGLADLSPSTGLYPYYYVSINTDGDGVSIINIEIADKDGNIMTPLSIPCTLSADTWHKLIVIGWQMGVIVNLNGINLTSWSSSISYPMEGMGYLVVGSNRPSDNFWVDSITIKNTTDYITYIIT